MKGSYDKYVVSTLVSLDVLWTYFGVLWIYFGVRWSIVGVLWSAFGCLWMTLDDF